MKYNNFNFVKMKYLIILILMGVYSCGSNSIVKTINENSIVVRTEKSNLPEKGKYFVVTESFNFYTNTNYKVNDTVYLTNKK